jgi:hypothetical protein
MAECTNLRLTQWLHLKILNPLSKPQVLIKLRPDSQIPKVWLRLKCDGTRAETRFRLSAKRSSPLKSAGASVQSTTGSRSVRISGSNAGYTMFRGSVKSTGYSLHSPVSPSLPLPWVTMCHHISTGLYFTHCPLQRSAVYGNTFSVLETHEKSRCRELTLRQVKRIIPQGTKQLTIM